MSKHNNNTSPSSRRTCRCGRKMTLGEDAAGIGLFNYDCPGCFGRRYLTQLTSAEYYEQFQR